MEWNQRLARRSQRDLPPHRHTSGIHGGGCPAPVRDNLSLSTPSGRLMLQVVGAMAEFERALTQEPVRAGLQLAQSKGKRLGRPRAAVDATWVAALRAAGVSWQTISQQLGIGVGTACRALQTLSKNPPDSPS